MKKLNPLSWLLPVFALIVLFQGCMKDNITKTYQIMTPVYADKAEVFANIKSGPAQAIAKAGKIFIRGNYLFINEVDKGIHIYDNSNPTNPRDVAFISIPGNIEVAVSGHYLYADMYTDMVTIDIGDPLQAKLVDTTLGVFPERAYGYGFAPDNSKIIVDWIIKDTTVTIDGTDGGIYPGGGCPNCSYYAVPAAQASPDKANNVPGIAGSMARFVIVNLYLYAVNQGALLVYDINNESNPVRKSEQYLGWLIETIYPFKNNLFIGSSSGMLIFNIDNPVAPEQVSAFSHASACDPVVSDGDYAFVTLRSNDRCAGNTNQLDVVDVSTLIHPELIKIYPMTGPKGLGKDGNLLFICDGTDGVKIYDAENVYDLKMINRIPDLDAFDVIPWANRLLVSASEGIMQYDYSDPMNIQLLSTIRTAGK